MEPKFKVGELVLVRSDADSIQWPKMRLWLSFNSDMKKYKNTEQVVSQVLSRTINGEIKTFWYKLQNVAWLWDESWLEIVESDIEIPETEILDLFGDD